MYILKNTDGECLGAVEVTTLPSNIMSKQHIEETLAESWNDYNRLEEHEFDPNNLNEFVSWHNRNWVVQINLLKTKIIKA
jgi:hypothetical protein